jgi:uncharacterized protein YjbI with pentapeptide repeats
VLKRWRRNRALRAELAKGYDFAGRDLSHASLHDLDLREKRFPKAVLRSCDLTAADLRGVDLREADLTGAYLTGAQLEGADLGGACLRGAYLIATNFRDARLDGADLEGTVYDQATTWPDGTQSAHRPH